MRPDHLDRRLDQRLSANGFHSDSGHRAPHFRGDIIFD
jgi:hypothetical protein